MHYSLSFYRLAPNHINLHHREGDYAFHYVNGCKFHSLMGRYGEELRKNIVLLCSMK
jgi:hypothetical protein